MTDECIAYFNANFTFAKRYRTNEYGIKLNGSNKYMTPQEVYSKYCTDRSKMGLPVSDTIDDVVKWITDNTPKDKEEERVPCRNWAIEWLKEHKDNWHFSNGWKAITYTYQGIPQNKTLEDVKDAMMEEIYNKQLPYKVEELKTALNCLARDADGMAITKIFNSIAYDASMVDPCDRFLHGLYNYLKPQESYEIFRTLMMHWGWICKRRMLGREVVWHIWINFWGATGLGKTTLLKKLCKPMADYTSVTTISMLFDSTREIAKLSQYYVLIFDELSINVEGEAGGNLTEDNKSTLKSILTADYLDTRVYGTQKQAKQKITFVPISSANHHLYDVVYDETSMRRFFEVHCTAERPESFAEINKYLEHADVFWRGIDEDLEDGYWHPNSEIGQEITKIQSQYYPTRTTTSMWIDACHVRPGTTSGTNSYKAYCNWCRETGNKQKTMQNFIRDIAHMIPDAIDKSGKAHLSFITDEEDDEPLFAKAPTSSMQFDPIMGFDTDEDVA